MSDGPEFKPPIFPNTDDSNGQVRCVYAEWAGSRIQIEDPEALARQLVDTGQETLLLRRTDQAALSAVQSFSMTARAVDAFGHKFLKLKTAIRLDKDLPKDINKIVSRFNTCIEPGYKNGEHDFQQRGRFNFYTSDLTSLMFAYDVAAKIRYAIKLQKDGIVVSNYRSFQPKRDPNYNDRNTIEPPTLRYPTVVEQFKSFTLLSVMMNDFMAGFWANNPNDGRITGIPMGLEYNIGLLTNEQRAVELKSSAGRAALTHDAGPEAEAVVEPNETHLEQDTEEYKITLDDVGGLANVKKKLREIAVSFGSPEIMKKWGVKLPTGIMLYGETGTGKTMLATALANEIGAEIRIVQATDIYNMWVGNSEKALKEIFTEAHEHDGPLVILFDEIDSILSNGRDRASDAVAGVFKQEMSSLRSKKPDVLIVAATNHLDRIDPAMLRAGRFDYKIDVPMPDQDARAQIFNNLMYARYNRLEADFMPFDFDVNVATLAKKTEGMSGADISEIVRRVAFAKALEEATSREQQQPIGMAELEAAIKNYYAS